MRFVAPFTDKFLDRNSPFSILFFAGLSALAPFVRRTGGVSERLKETVLKTVDPHGSVGSNPTPTANFPLASKWFGLDFAYICV